MTGIPIYNVNNNCATGSSALHLAKNLVAGGVYNCVLAAGFEKMARGSLSAAFSDRTNPIQNFLEKTIELMPTEEMPKAFAPVMFGNAGLEHMKVYGTKPEHFAKVAAKNHKHSLNNPYSQFRDGHSVETVLKSPKIYGMLTKLQCCPTSDGAGAAIICDEETLKKLKREN
jgi:sterol carrier protein 2